jgi:hypothetical protein
MRQARRYTTRPKQRVSRAECEQVFFNRPLRGAPDAGHSRSEARLAVFGRTDAGRLLFVAFTLRGSLVRVIPARDMSRRERRIYEQG